MKFKLTNLAILALACSFTFLQAPRWKVMDDYTVTFSSKKVNGSFRGLSAVIFFDEANLEASKIIASLQAKTIDTGIGLRNKHAMSETGLNAEKSPEISFESSRIVKLGGSYEATGKLTLKEISKEIKLPFTFERTGTKGIFKGKFSISPKDYNVTRNGSPDVVEIELIIPVTQ